MTAVHKAPGDYPSGKEGDVLTVDFTVLGVPCLGLNGGPEFKHSEAFSFQVATDTQEETDRYWNAIVGNGGKESQCGWCNPRDRHRVTVHEQDRLLLDEAALDADNAGYTIVRVAPAAALEGLPVSELPGGHRLLTHDE